MLATCGTPATGSSAASRTPCRTSVCDGPNFMMVPAFSTGSRSHAAVFTGIKATGLTQPTHERQARQLLLTELCALPLPLLVEQDALLAGAPFGPGECLRGGQI